MGKRKGKPLLRRLRSRLIDKSGGRTLATQEQQIKKLGLGAKKGGRKKK